MRHADIPTTITPVSARILDGSFTYIKREPVELSRAGERGQMQNRLRVVRAFKVIQGRPAAAWTLAIIATLAASSLTLRQHIGDPLQRLHLGHRTVEARLAGLEYAPFSTTRTSATVLPQRAETYAVIAELQARVEELPSPENLQRLAKATMAIGDETRALALLEEAHRREPNDASILSDLAAVELAAGQIGDATEHSATATERDPASLEAAFTWAIALEAFSNRPAAVDAWRRYLMMDPAGPWADEARQRLAALEQRRPTWAEERMALVAGADALTIQRLVRKYPWHTRLRILNILLPSWAKSADPAVFALMHGMASERAASDRFLLDVVEHAGRARNAVVPGIEQFRAAMNEVESGHFAEAASLFDDAARTLESAGSPMWIISSIYAANMESGAGRAREALTRIDRLTSRMAALNGRYPSMTCDAIWMRGLLRARGGFPALALVDFREAAAAARRSGEIEQEAAVQQLIASTLQFHGDASEAEAVLISALRASHAIDADRDRMFGAYADAAFAALRAGRPRVARAFAHAQMGVAEDEYGARVRAAQSISDAAMRDRMLAIARETLDRWGADSDVRRALSVLEIGRLDAAAKSLASARTRAMTIATREYRERVFADVDFAAGLLALRRGDPREAVAAFTSAMTTWERQDWRLHTAVGHLARADAYRTAGDRRAAEDDYRAGIEEMEAQRNGLEPDLRVAYFERAERLFERLIDLLLEDHRHAEALTVAERKRARVLLEQLAAGEPAVPLDAERIRTSVPAGHALLQITLLEKTAEMWLVYHGRVAYARSVASRDAIEAAAARHLTAIDSGDDTALRREGRLLHDQLMAPFLPALPPDTTLIVVSDGALQAVPFATLVTPDGRYLVERFALASAASASVFFHRTTSHSYDTLLAVAQPRPGDLRPLSGATVEAKAAANNHRRGRYVSGTAIGPDEFLESAGDVACVHFAGHAKTDVDHPSRSALLFESTNGPPAELTASQIAGRRLRSAPLVVLAACSTGRGKQRRNEGIQSLAAAFLQAGARGVVATLWDVDDVRSARLFRSFHQQLREGARPADALRSAQRALLRSSDPRDRSPSVWASAVIEGTR